MTIEEPVASFDFSGPVVKAGDKLIPIAQIKYIAIDRIEEQLVTIRTVEDEYHHAFGFDAIEIVMQLKPSALEGRRLKWRKNAWAFHNFIAHPVMQILVWMGRKKAAIRLHDKTTPRPR